MAMLHQQFSDGPEAPWRLTNPDAAVDGYQHRWIRARTGPFFGVRDQRVQELEGSAADAALQLAGIYPFKEDTKNAFGVQLRQMLYQELRPLRNAHTELIDTEQLHPDTREEAYKAASLALKAVDPGSERRRYNRQYRDGSGRLDDVELSAFYGIYWYPSRHILNGDNRQLGPMYFGPLTDNPWQAQCQTPFIGRLSMTGFPVCTPRDTNRFHHMDLIEGVRIVYNNPYITFAEGLTPDVYKPTSSHLYGLDAYTLFVNIPESVTSSKDSNGSNYNLTTAVVVMDDLIKRVEYVEGGDILSMTSYVAQVNLYIAYVHRAALQQVDAGRHDIARKVVDVGIAQLKLSTIDGFKLPDTGRLDLTIAV